MITAAKLIEQLSSNPRCQFVTLQTETEPDMRKTDNPYKGRIRKVSTVNGVINWSYNRAVNSQRLREDKEPDFTPYPRAWGERIKGTPIIKHTGALRIEQYYLEVKVERIEYEYLLDNKPVNELVITPWLTKCKDPSIRQDLDRPVVLRDYRLDHIKAINFSGKTEKII